MNMKIFTSNHPKSSQNPEKSLVYTAHQKLMNCRKRVTRKWAKKAGTNCRSMESPATFQITGCGHGINPGRKKTGQNPPIGVHLAKKIRLLWMSRSLRAIRSVPRHFNETRALAKHARKYSSRRYTAYRVFFLIDKSSPWCYADPSLRHSRSLVFNKYIFRSILFVYYNAHSFITIYSFREKWGKTSCQLNLTSKIAQHTFLKKGLNFKNFTSFQWKTMLPFSSIETHFSIDHSRQNHPNPRDIE